MKRYPLTYIIYKTKFQKEVNLVSRKLDNSIVTELVGLLEGIRTCLISIKESGASNFEVEYFVVRSTPGNLGLQSLTREEEIEAHLNLKKSYIEGKKKEGETGE